MVQNQSKDLFLIDFGVGKQLERNLESAMGKSPMMSIVGKPAYCPPEQMATGECSEASDLYALGVIAVELLYGKRPPNLWDWSQDLPQPISELLMSVLHKMLAHNVNDRYGSAQEVLEVLDYETTQIQTPIGSHPSTPAPQPPAPAAAPSTASEKTTIVDTAVDSAPPAIPQPAVDPVTVGDQSDAGVNQGGKPAGDRGVETVDQWPMGHFDPSPPDAKIPDNAALVEPPPASAKTAPPQELGQPGSVSGRAAPPPQNPPAAATVGSYDKAAVTYSSSLDPGATAVGTTPRCRGR